MNEDRRADSEGVEAIMRRAEAIGLSPERVARALGDRPLERQETNEPKRPRLFRRLRSKARA